MKSRPVGAELFRTDRPDRPDRQTDRHKEERTDGRRNMKLIVAFRNLRMCLKTRIPGHRTESLPT